MTWTGDPLGDTQEEASGGVLGAGRCQHVAQEALIGLVVMVEHGLEQTEFIAEGCINAGGIDPHRCRQIGHRGAFIALAPEHLHGLIEGGMHVEFPRAP